MRLCTKSTWGLCSNQTTFPAENDPWIKSYGNSLSQSLARSCCFISCYVCIKLHPLHLHLVAALALMASIVLRDLLLFLRNFGSQPFKDWYLFLRGFLIPFLWAFLVWLWAVWFLLFAIFDELLEYLQFI